MDELPFCKILCKFSITSQYLQPCPQRNKESTGSMQASWTKLLEHIPTQIALDHDKYSARAGIHGEAEIEKLPSLHHMPHHCYKSAVAEIGYPSPGPAPEGMLHNTSAPPPDVISLSPPMAAEGPDFGTQQLYHLDELPCEPLSYATTVPGVDHVPSYVHLSTQQQSAAEVQGIRFVLPPDHTRMIEMQRQGELGQQHQYLSQTAAVDRQPPSLYIPQSFFVSKSGHIEYIWPQHPYSFNIDRDQKQRGRRSACTCPNCQRGLNAKNLWKDGSIKKKEHTCHYPHCNKVYSQTYHLRTHLRWHAGDKPFVCNWLMCGKRFIRSDELQRHVRIHTREKKFVCRVCEKRFMRSDHLSKHIRTHMRKDAEMQRISIQNEACVNGNSRGSSPDRSCVSVSSSSDDASGSISEPSSDVELDDCASSSQDSGVW